MLDIAQLKQKIYRRYQSSAKIQHKFDLDQIYQLFYKDIKLMFKLVAITILLYLSNSLTLEVNNIHYGYRNIYKSTEIELTEGQVTLNNYKLTKEELAKDVTGFIKVEGSSASFDFNSLARQYELDQIDPSAPVLAYLFIQKPFIVVRVFSESEDEAEIEILNQLVSFGKDRSELDL